MLTRVFATLVLVAITTTGCSGSSTKSDAGASPDLGGSGGGADMALPSFAVAVTTRTFVDSSRPTPANGSAPAQSSRSLTTEIWYPTPGAPDATDATRDAPLASGGPFPLVLFVHGSSGSRTVYTYLTIGLAAAGYVVAAADFPLTAMDTPGGPSDEHVTDQVGDLSFLCDQLKAAAGDTTDALHGAVDGLGYAVVGHSTGGAVGELAAFAGNDSAITHDPRVKAVVPLSGDACMFNASFFKNRSVPIFVIGATDDLFVPVADNGQWVFDNTNAPHLLATLTGGQHVYYTDYGLPDSLADPVPTGPTSVLATTLSAYGDASECLPVPPAGTDPQMAFATEHAYVLQLVTAYLDAQLRAAPANLMTLIAAHDPLVVFQQ